MWSRLWHSCRYLLKISYIAHFLIDWLSCLVVEMNIQISQGNAATDLRGGGRLYKSFFWSSLHNVLWVLFLVCLIAITYYSLSVGLLFVRSIELFSIAWHSIDFLLCDHSFNCCALLLFSCTSLCMCVSVSLMILGSSGRLCVHDMEVLLIGCNFWIELWWFWINLGWFAGCRLNKIMFKWTRSLSNASLSS